MQSLATDKHAAIWGAIDRLAKRKSLTPCGLAKLASLDPTTFNRSKRVRPDGQPRWPSTETINAVLVSTGMDWVEFGIMVEGVEHSDHDRR